MSSLRAAARRVLFRLLRKREDAVVVTFLSGPVREAGAMLDEVRALLPERRHYAVVMDSGVVGQAILPADPLSSGSRPEGMPAAARIGCPTDLITIRIPPGLGAWAIAAHLRRELRRERIGMVPVLFGCDDEGAQFTPLRRAAFLLAPRKILAYNVRLERHHLRLLSTPVASWLFLRGVALDRIWLRPRWLWPWRRREHSVFPTVPTVLEGRACSPSRPRAAVVSPYFPYPLSHGGAVRIFHLLQEAAKHFDVFLFCVHEPGQLDEAAPVLEMCARVAAFEMPRYREPRWATLAPPEAREFHVPAMREWLERYRREFSIGLVQVEYTHMATYPGDILVEHDVTYDLYHQAWRRRRTTGARWDWWRWRRFERRAIQRFRRVVTMSDKDAAMLGVAHAVAIPNGVALERFRPTPEPCGGKRLLFVGSFRHLPNIVAYRFLIEQVWPRVLEREPEAELTVVAGPDPLLYWRAANQPGEPQCCAGAARVKFHAFVRDVRPLYEASNLVVVPTLESAGTNLKVLEAMAIERAVVSTPSGCAGLGLEDGHSVAIGDSAEAFAGAVLALLEDPARRAAMARLAREHAERHFGWTALGERQRALWQEVLDERR